jgi:hypothetical protein
MLACASCCCCFHCRAGSTLSFSNRLQPWSDGSYHRRPGLQLHCYGNSVHHHNCLTPQLPAVTCCQYTPDGVDYWCASPSANAVASAFSEALVTTSTDYATPDFSDIRSFDDLLYQRIREVDVRVRTVCAKVSLREHQLSVAAVGPSRLADDHAELQLGPDSGGLKQQRGITDCMQLLLIFVNGW